MIKPVFFWFIAFTLCSFHVQAQEGSRVQEIRFEGEVRRTYAQIRDNIKTQVGEPYNEDHAGDDIKLINEQYGLQATFEVIPVEGGLRVVIHLNEDLPILEKVVRGVEETEADAIWKLLGFDRNTFPTRFNLKTHAKRIRAHYLEEGHYFAEVYPYLERIEGGARAVYDVYLGEKVIVEEVNFIGLEEVDDSDLRSVMSLGEPILWIFTDKLKMDVLSKDISKLNEYMREEGYLDARVTLDSLAFNDDYDEATINILVQEGQRFKIRNVRVEGTRAFFPEQIHELIRTSEGAYYHGTRVRADVRRITRHYQDRGYIRAYVRGPQMQYDERLPLVDLTYQVEEGRQKTLRDVIVSGNAVTRDKVVRRKITLNPGDLFKHDEYRWSFNELLGDNFFTDSTGRPLLDMRPVSTDDPQLEDLLIQVGEGGTGFFFFNVGVSTDMGMIGGIRINKNNFDLDDPPTSLLDLPGEFFGNHHAYHGGGQNLTLSAQPGTHTSSYSVNFFEPYLWDTQPYPISLGLDVYSTAVDYTDYDEKRYGASPVLGKQWTREFYTSLGFRSELINLSHLDEVIAQDVRDFSGKNGYRGLEARISYRDVDNPRIPTQGFSSLLTYEYAGGFMGADVEISKAIATHTFYIPVYETEDGQRHVLSLKGAFGWAEPHSSMDKVPIFERLFVGGASGHFPVRGFKWREIGPRAEDEPIGGNGSVGASAEYSIPLLSEYNRELDVEDTRLKGVFFFDMGNVAKDIHERDLMHRLRTSAGLGIKFSLPVLGGMPVAIYYGVPLKKYPGDERRSLNLSLSGIF